MTFVADLGTAESALTDARRFVERIVTYLAETEGIQG